MNPTHLHLPTSSFVFADGYDAAELRPLVDEDRLPGWRAAMWSRVKARRDQAQDGGCATPLGRVDTDELSRGKISGAVQLAMIAAAAGQPFAIGWTMHDNSTAVHDGPAMIALGVAVGQHVAACHAVALAKRDAVEAAATLAEIEAIDVETDWPGA